MRLLLHLKTTDAEVSLNYNHALSSAIYKLLMFGSDEFADFLHKTGYKSNNRTYKLFTFSLKFEMASFINGTLKLKSPNASLYISSPMIDDFVKNLVVGTFKSRVIEIYSEYIKTSFKIMEAEILPTPDFSDEMQFSLMAPLVLSTHSINNGKLSRRFFRYDDDINEINRVFVRNLTNKYEAISNIKYEGPGLKLKWNEEYIKSSIQKGKRLSKKVNINKDINDPVEVIGIFCPFSVDGDPELIKVGYECGFGERNSMGFGMVYNEI